MFRSKMDILNTVYVIVLTLYVFKNIYFSRYTLKALDIARSVILQGYFKIHLYALCQRESMGTVAKHLE